MEDLIAYTAKEIRLIKIFFRIVGLIILGTIILLFVIKINDSVSFANGEIIATNPQIKYTVPFDCVIEKVLIKEGQRVKRGDTLIVLYNKKLILDYASKTKELQAQNQKIVILEKLIANTENRIEKLIEEGILALEGFKYQQKANLEEVQMLDNNLKLTYHQHVINKAKLSTDSALYIEKALAKIEMGESYIKYLDYEKTYREVKNKALQQKIESKKLKNNYDLRASEIKLEIISVENELQNLRESKLSLESEIERNQNELNFYKDELSKLCLISKENGTITNLSNIKQKNYLLSKGELLAVTAPTEESFYAKINALQDDMRFIKKGQEVHLKLDAYYYYQFGVIKGKVDYISSFDQNNNFYVLVKILKKPKAVSLRGGYMTKGDIIIENMRLYEFIIKKLFKKIDNYF